MAGAGVTSGRIFGLGRGTGKGPKLLAALLEISTNETLETGMQKIHAVTFCPYGANCDEYAKVQSVSNGQITFSAGKTSDGTTQVADVAAYMLAVGTMEKATK